MRIKKDHPIYEIQIEKGDPYPWPMPLESRRSNWETIVFDTSKIGDLTEEEIISHISQCFMVKIETVENAFYKAKVKSMEQHKNESEEPWHWSIQQTKYYEGHKYILWRCLDYKLILN